VARHKKCTFLLPYSTISAECNKCQTLVPIKRENEDYKSEFIDQEEGVDPLTYVGIEHNIEDNFDLRTKEEQASDTGKSLSEALIFASTKPQYDDRLFFELQVQYIKIQSSNLGRTCCVQKLFITFRTIFVHNMFSPCSAKRRVSYKDLPVQKMLKIANETDVRVNKFLD
jgi:hypothetical protein